MAGLEGQKAIIFGGSSGLGLASAQALAAVGAAVAIVGRSPDKLEAAASHIQGTVSSHVVDATDETEVLAFFQRFGEFDHLVISVGGVGYPRPFRDIDQASFRTWFDNKFWAQFSVAHAGAPYLRPSGSITFISGAASRRAIPGMVEYAAVNGAIEAIIGPLALELAPSRVNAVSPGVIDTPFWDRMPQEMKTNSFERMAKVLPVGRIGKSEDVANAVLYLTTTGFVTGTILEVEGGLRHASL